MVTAGGLALNGTIKFWLQVSYWPVEKIKAVFKALLFRQLRRLVKKGKIFNPHGSYGNFNRILDEIYHKNWNIFVGFKEGKGKAKAGFSYITRYAKRAIISDRKLISYCNGLIKFQAKEVKVTLPVSEFIKRVLRHVMPKYFKITRFYGLYSNKKRKKLVPLAKKLMGAENIKSFPKQNWRERRKKYSGVDPIICPKCGQEMTLIAVSYSERIPKGYEEILTFSPFDHFL